jgi:Lysozyme like domain
MGKLGWMVVVASVSMLSMVGCAAETEGDEEIEETEDALLAGRKIPEREVASLLREAGFPENQIGKMVCTAKWESSFYERASNKKNRNGSIDRGLFQINSVHLGAWSCPRNGELLYTAKVNADCAYDIWKAQGNRAWYGYRAHKTECDSYNVDE